MTLKTLLVCLTTSEHADALLKAAVPLARKHGAHLIGIHTIEALVVYPGIAMHIPESVFASFSASQRDESESIKAIFEKYTKSEDFSSEFRLLKSGSVSASERMVESARSADLVMMAHGDKDGDRYDQRDAQQLVIRKSGRPVIVVPLNYDGPPIGNNILLGWSDTREAARAAHDLLTVAERGAKVTVLRVGKKLPDEMKDFDGLDLTEMLSRHDLVSTLEHREPKGDVIADVVNKAAFETGADLIVTGAFGHSKAYDIVMGATSHALLREANLPVMFSR